VNKIAVIGMAGNSAFLSVDHFHAPGETVAAEGIHFEPGGKGFNQAVAAARFGGEVSFLCAVGREHQQQIRQFLLNDGITPVLAEKAESTAFASILTDKQGQNQVTVYQGAQLEVTDVELFAKFIAEADILLLNNEVPQPVNERAIAIAKAHNTYVILNPAPARTLSAPVLAQTDLFTPNEQEAEDLPDVKNAVITLGSKGCKICRTGEILPALPIPHAVDTTGAGDTFNGVLAVGLARGADLKAALTDAIRASGVSVTRKYAATAIPTSAEVSEFIKQQEEIL